MLKTKMIAALDAVTANATSNKICVQGARRVGFLFRRADHSSGSSAFSVRASMETPDVVTPTMTALNLLIDNVTNSNVQNLTRVNGKTLSANGDALLWLDENAFVNFVDVAVVETTDGTHSAWVVIEEEA